MNPDQICKIVEFTVRHETMVAPVEEAMRRYAVYLGEQFPAVRWLTFKKEGSSRSYVTYFVAPDEDTEQSMIESNGTRQFAELLDANTQDPPRWTALHPVAFSQDVT